MKEKNIFAKIGEAIMYIIAIVLLSIIFDVYVMRFMFLRSGFLEGTGIVADIVAFVISMAASVAIVLFAATNRKKKEAEEKLRGADSMIDSKSDIGWVGMIALLLLLAFLSYAVGWMVYLFIWDILSVI